MSNAIRVILLGALTLGAAAPAYSQSIPLAIGGYVGGATPTGDWSEGNEVDTGWGYGGAVSFRLLPFVALYVGWDQYRFGFTDPGAVEDVDVTLMDSGLRAGAEIGIPLPIPVSPFVMGGGYYGDTEFEITEGETQTRFRGGDDFGYEVAGGVNVSVGTVTVRPIIGYRTRDAGLPDLGAGGIAEQTTIAYYYFSIGATLVP